MLAGVYALALIPELPTIIAHTWWSADSGSAGVVAQLYSHPPPGQYIVLGNHGWYEALSFYLLTRALPGTGAVVQRSDRCLGDDSRAGRGIGRQGVRALGRRFGDGALLCLAPGGLMLVFQPTAHTNVVFHAAALAAVAGWVLPRIRTLSLAVVLSVGVAIGAFTGLAIAGDAIALAWAVVPFVVAAGVCAARSPGRPARTLAFAVATLTAMLVATVVFTAIMHSAGFRVDELAQSLEARFVKPDALAGTSAIAERAQYLVGGNFLGHPIDRDGLLELVSGGTLLLGAGAVLFAVYAGPLRPYAGPNGVRFRPAARPTRHRRQPQAGACCVLEHLPGVRAAHVPAVLGRLVDYRYLVGPVVAIAALVPLCAARGGDWRIAIAAGLSVLALTGLVRLTQDLCLTCRPTPHSLLGI